MYYGNIYFAVATENFDGFLLNLVGPTRGAGQKYVVEGTLLERTFFSD